MVEFEGSEFCNREVRKLAVDWQNCKLMYSRPCHPQSQDSMKKAIQIILPMGFSCLTVLSMHIHAIDLL